MGLPRDSLRRRLSGPHRPVRPGLDRRGLRERHRPESWVGSGEEARAIPPEGMHCGGHRRAQEPGRRGARQRKAQLGEDADGPRHPRRGEPDRPRQRGRKARRSASRAAPRIGTGPTSTTWST